MVMGAKESETVISMPNLGHCHLPPSPMSTKNFLEFSLFGTQVIMMLLV